MTTNPDLPAGMSWEPRQPEPLKLYGITTAELIHAADSLAAALRTAFGHPAVDAPPPAAIQPQNAEQAPAARPDTPRPAHAHTGGQTTGAQPSES